MKKIPFLTLLIAIFALTSCNSIRTSATYQDPTNILRTATVADLDVSDTKITFTFKPSFAVRRGGDKNVIKAAVQEALRINGGGDVLVGMEYITVSKITILPFVSRIREVTVTGRPAKYTNFHSLGDGVWGNTPLYPCCVSEKSNNILINR